MFMAQTPKRTGLHLVRERLRAVNRDNLGCQSKKDSEVPGLESCLFAKFKQAFGSVRDDLFARSSGGAGVETEVSMGVETGGR
jgi:hypothetical protein